MIRERDLKAILREDKGYSLEVYNYGFEKGRKISYRRESFFLLEISLVVVLLIIVIAILDIRLDKLITQRDNLIKENSDLEINNKILCNNVKDDFFKYQSKESYGCDNEDETIVFYSFDNRSALGVVEE